MNAECFIQSANNIFRRLLRHCDHTVIRRFKAHFRSIAKGLFLCLGFTYEKNPLKMYALAPSVSSIIFEISFQ